jgi:hypothetical protein
MNTSNRKMNTSNKQVAYKTFCKVCQDASKSEKEYTSHNVRDARGTCCPTLLAQECRTCYKKGHTSKYCTQSKTVAQTPAFVVKPVPNQVKQHMPKNVFMLLESDSEDEKEPVIIKKTEPAPVPLAELKIAQKQVLNYSRIIALAPVLVKTEVIAAVLKENTVAKKAHGPMKTPFSWATCESDISDISDDEDDETEDNSAW